MMNEHVVAFDDIEHRLLGSERWGDRRHQGFVLQCGLIEFVKSHQVRHVERTIDRVDIIGTQP